MKRVISNICYYFDPQTKLLTEEAVRVWQLVMVAGCPLHACLVMSFGQPAIKRKARRPRYLTRRYFPEVGARQ